MLVSKALYAVTTIFAIFSIYATFYGFYLTTVKFNQTSQTNLLDTKSPQWFEPKTKVIMLVVDALRFDYLAQDQNKQNKLEKFSNLLTTSPKNTILLKAKSEVPTLAIERIPALMTGNIPPKANIIRAFGATSISEDNLLKQLSNANKKVYFSGPQVWTQMFPNEFTESNTNYENLQNTNIDSLTTTFIQDKIQQNNYDLIIGHLFGIDKAGHSYGLADSRVAKAIEKVDDFIIGLTNKMDEDTMLIVLGDHGMTDLGEHGQGSPEELDTVIAAYYKKGFQKYQDEALLKDIMKSYKKETNLSVKQVDIVPTISMLMGVPISFSNMGNILNDFYPSVTTDSLKCPKTNIDINPAYMKTMLQDNHLNSLQIVQYFEKFQAKTRLFNSQETKDIKTLQQKVYSTHGSAMNMIKNQLQCDESFNTTVTNAILTSQKLSDQVYLMVLNKGSYDLSLIYQGVALLLLVLASYLLLVQYLYRYGMGENSLLFNLTNTAIASRKALPVLIIVLLVSLTTWYFKRRIIHPITSSFLCVAIWLFCVFSGFVFQKTQYNAQDDSPMPAEVRIQLHQAHIASQEKELHSALRKQKSKKKLDINNHPEPEKPEEVGIPDRSMSDPKLPFDKVPLFNKESQNNQILQSSTLFLLKNPGYSVFAALAITVCMILAHKSHYETLDYTSAESSALAITLIFFTLRLSTLLAHNIYLQLTGVIFFIAILLIMTFALPLAKIRVILGLILVFDWLLTEVKHLVYKLQASKIIGYSHLACFITITVYQLIDNRESNWAAEIILPRIISACLLAIIIFSLKFRGDNQRSIKRNLQLCLVQFLLLVQAPKEIFVFGFLLSIMRLTTHLFKRANPGNFLYPLIIAIESHLGIFFLGHNDRWIPAGFTDFSGFSSVLAPFVVFLHLITSYILGLLTISQRSNAYSQIINKRNVVIFVLLFNIVYFGAVVKAYVNLEFYFNESIEKFVLDATIYIFTMISGYFIF